MPFAAGLTGAASLGLGIAGMVSQSRAAKAQEHAQAVDRESARQATILEYEKLDITIDQLTRRAGVIGGTVGAALAGAGAETTSGVSAQARAITFSALARDIEVSRLNTDIAATRLGFGPSVGGTESRIALEDKADLDRSLRAIKLFRFGKEVVSADEAAAKAEAQ